MGPLAVFGITNDGLNLAVNLLLLFLVVLWLRAGLLDLLGRPPPDRRPDARGLRHRGLAVPLRRHDRLPDRAPARVPRGRARARAGDRRRRGATGERRSTCSCPYCAHEIERIVPALPELPAPAQGAVQHLRQAARPALEDLPLLRGRGGRPRAAAGAPAPATRRARAPQPRRPVGSRQAPRGRATRVVARSGRRRPRPHPGHRARRPRRSPSSRPARRKQADGGLREAAHPQAGGHRRGQAGRRLEGQRERASKPTRERQPAAAASAPRDSARGPAAGPCLTHTD